LQRRFAENVVSKKSEVSTCRLHRAYGSSSENFGFTLDSGLREIIQWNPLDISSISSNIKYLFLSKNIVIWTVRDGTISGLGGNRKNEYLSFTGQFFRLICTFIKIISSDKTNFFNVWPYFWSVSSVQILNFALIALTRNQKIWSHIEYEVHTDDTSQK